MRPQLERARRIRREAAEAALVLMAEDLAGRAANDAPIDTGTLRASVSPGPDNPATIRRTPRAAGERVEVEVRFSTPYAAAQHEAHAIMHRDGTTYEWRARHYPRGGGPKFLERNLTAMAPRYSAFLKAKVSEALHGRS